MLRNETKDEIKLTSKIDLPKISREHLKELISTYHFKKQSDDKGKMFRSAESKFMLDLNHLYKTLDKKNTDLNDKEIKKLINIIFRQTSLDPNTQFVVNDLLFNYFEANIVAALDSDMLRNRELHPIDSYFIEDHKLTASKELKALTGKELQNIINHYEKRKEIEASKRLISFKMPNSQIMLDIKNFYSQNLKLENRALTEDEYFELIKMTYNKNQGKSKTQSIVNTLLFYYFNSELIRALDSAMVRVGSIEPLKKHFKLMSDHPEIAANIAYSVLILDSVIKAANQFDKTQQLYAKDLYEHTINDVKLTTAVLDTYKTILKSFREAGEVAPFEQIPKDLSQVLKHDILFYLSLKLVQADQFALDIYKTLTKLHFIELKDIAAKMVESDNPKKVIHDYTFIKACGPLYGTPYFRINGEIPGQQGEEKEVKQRMFTS